jgi:hypothetical protein
MLIYMPRRSTPVIRGAVLSVFFVLAAVAQQPAPASGPPQAVTSAAPSATGSFTPQTINTTRLFSVSEKPGSDPREFEIRLNPASNISTIVTVRPVTGQESLPNPGMFYYADAQGAFLTYIVLPPEQGGPFLAVMRISPAVSTGAASPVPPVRAAATPSAHQSSSEFTTVSHKSQDFKMPLRFEKHGVGIGQPRIWLIWDGKNELQVEPVETKFKDNLWAIPVLGGDVSHLKFLANVYTQGSPAPRYFYLKKNNDDSITVYGNDDIAKLKAIEKGKAK